LVLRRRARIYVGLENGDAVDVINTMTDKVIAGVPARRRGRGNSA
jgi:YVTN family beta-propeller protein